MNGVDIDAVKQTREAAKTDPKTAEREPKLVAHWLGGSETRIEMGDKSMKIGGVGELRAMQALLASLLACNVDVVVMNATLMGLVIERLWVEATGHFTTQAFYGVDGAPDPGYDRISYTIHVKAPQATPEQLAELKEKCEKTSPVGHSLMKSIPLSVTIQAE